MFKQIMGSPKKTQLHTPPMWSQQSQAHQTPQMGGNVFAILAHKGAINGRNHTQDGTQLPTEKEAPRLCLLKPLKVYLISSTTDPEGTGKRTTPDNLAGMLIILSIIPMSQQSIHCLQ